MTYIYKNTTIAHSMFIILSTIDGSAASYYSREQHEIRVHYKAMVNVPFAHLSSSWLKETTSTYRSIPLNTLPSVFSINVNKKLCRLFFVLSNSFPRALSLVKRKLSSRVLVTSRRDFKIQPAGKYMFNDHERYYQKQILFGIFFDRFLPKIYQYHRLHIIHRKCTSYPFRISRTDLQFGHRNGVLLSMFRLNTTLHHLLTLGVNLEWCARNSSTMSSFTKSAQVILYFLYVIVFRTSIKCVNVSVICKTHRYPMVHVANVS